MSSYITNMQSCIWFENNSERNTFAAMLAGTLFFGGWWFIIDAHARYPSEMSNSYYVCGVVGTISLMMINSVSNHQIRGDTYSNGCLGARGVRSFLFVGFLLGFSAVIAASWILFSDFVAADAEHHWPGVGLLLQNLCIFFGSLTYKFGRTDDEWI